MKVRRSHVIEAMEKNIFLRVAIYIYIYICIYTHDALGCSCFHCTVVRFKISLPFRKYNYFAVFYSICYFTILPDDGFITGQICNHVVQQSSFILSIKVVLTELTPFLIL